MITNIPLCLARAILCNWLEDMKSIVNLDSAICGKGRSTWLDILKDDFVVLRKLVILHPTRVPIASLLEWISLRHVRVLEFGFPGWQMTCIPAERSAGPLAILASTARSLRLSNCLEVSLEKYGSLGLLFSAVEKLSLTQCWVTAGIHAFLHERLQTLDIHLCATAPFIAFNTVPLRCLKHVKLRSTSFVSHVDGMLAVILPQAPGVTELQIAVTRSSQPLQPATVDHVVRHCHKLQYLYVTCDDLSFRDEWLDAIAKACPDLVGVMISRAGAVGIQSLVSHCQQLRLLRVPGDDRTLQLVAEHCGDRLLGLEVDNVQFSGAVGMIAVAEHCTGLRGFALYGADMTRRTDHLTDVIMTLVQRCRSLRYVDFSDTKFDTSALDLLAECRPAITHLAISPQSSAVSFLRLLRNCSNLRELAMPLEPYSGSDNTRFWRDLACETLAGALPRVRMVKYCRFALWDEHLTL
jgi:hypothetical protein